MPNFARVELIGHLGADPEVKTASGDAVAVFSLATSRKRQEQEITTWWRCAVWGRRADVIGQYVRKGDPLHLVGEPVLRPYTDRDGVARVSLEVQVSDFTLLRGRADAPVATSGQAGAASSQGPACGAGASMEEAIPFDLVARGQA